MNAPVEVNFLVNTAIASEPNNGESSSIAFQYQIAITGAFDEPLSFNLTTSDGTATAGEDYVAVDEVVTILPANVETDGSSTSIGNNNIGNNNTDGKIIQIGGSGTGTTNLFESVTVDLLADEEDESAEGFSLSITNPVGVTVGRSTATAIIEDDSNGESDNSDGDADNVIELFRFRNTTFDTGTYIFVSEAEKEQIIDNLDQNRTFALEGNGEPAFIASSSEGDDLAPFYRFQSDVTPGSYIFVGEEERNNIQENFADSFTEEGLAFYAYDAGTGIGEEFNRLRNTSNGTYLFANSTETEAILSDRDLANTFTNEGVAFESL